MSEHPLIALRREILAEVSRLERLADECLELYERQAEGRPPVSPTLAALVDAVKSGDAGAIARAVSAELGVPVAADLGGAIKMLEAPPVTPVAVPEDDSRRAFARRLAAGGIPVVIATVFARRVGAQSPNMSAGCGSIAPGGGSCAPESGALELKRPAGGEDISEEPKKPGGWLTE